ncbi:MAG TPA: hypothetical protein VLV87_08685 [Gammaproteobacteria bacterium]|nr:hypothetical protein [Gammaproteobacteria bacterium]
MSMNPYAAGASLIMGGAQNNMAQGQGPLQAYADPGDFFGGNSAQAMDPIGYGIFNALGIKNWDPLVAATNKIPGFHGTEPRGQSSVPSVLPTLPNVGAPRIYSPNSFSGYADLGSGPYNQMASHMAGKMYGPVPIQPAGSGKGLIPAPTSGKGGLLPTIGGASSTMPIGIRTKAK